MYFKKTPIPFTIIDTPENARCLDGSKPGIYYRPGEHKRNTLIYLEGVGNCAGHTVDDILENCYQRSFTLIGSSKYRPSFFNESEIEGIFREDDKTFGRWNLLIIPTCEGNLIQLILNILILVKCLLLMQEMLLLNIKILLCISGHKKMLMFIFDYMIKNYQLNLNHNVILSGSSAGAFGAHQYANYLQKILPLTDVRIIPDSGFFLDSPEPFQQIVQVFGNFIKNDHYKTIFPECKYQTIGSDFYKCILLKYSWEFIQTDAFIIGSLYDNWALQYIYQIPCYNHFDQCDPETLQFILSYGETYKMLLSNILSKKPNWGSWLISCGFHDFVQTNWYSNRNFTIPSSSKYTGQESLDQWINYRFLKSKQRIDQVPYPNNKNCAYQYK
ncbi:pectinacetylesterase family protein (macronuclear) [Tetrahymena thermophila SB210]|uniref:Pectinacetylesterase family protein n=1 Tax=Tetrahymena thermophila (strain SB210) TaxID=312017 RepID=Q23H71_TETTS|nr:pectinacetylesterase family protein [Tetrahymena thermophila SB210]EAR95937.2 pectinacetylesterase family protein [Tetrahymena thermophila SB210]|eukprot:XP_001016182.2 pectinacetylesterase family protein [Tetrahymena thermophila SB210]